MIFSRFLVLLFGATVLPSAVFAPKSKPLRVDVHAEPRLVDDCDTSSPIQRRQQGKKETHFDGFATPVSDASSQTYHSDDEYSVEGAESPAATPLVINTSDERALDIRYAEAVHRARMSIMRMYDGLLAFDGALKKLHGAGIVKDGKDPAELEIIFKKLCDQYRTILYKAVGLQLGDVPVGLVLFEDRGISFRDWRLVFGVCARCSCYRYDFRLKECPTTIERRGEVKRCGAVFAEMRRVFCVSHYAIGKIEKLFGMCEAGNSNIRAYIDLMRKALGCV